jgi:hypothetical protein
MILVCCANTLSQEQELSGPEVMSYIMGWGNHYILHHFETIPCVADDYWLHQAS